jgi:hypothetical protein
MKRFFTGSRHVAQLALLHGALLHGACADEHAPSPDDAAPSAEADGATDAGVASAPDTVIWLDEDCDPEDPQRAPGFYERFADGIDSNCDGQDDPAPSHDPCTCDWLSAGDNPQVQSSCATHFNPLEAQQAVMAAAPAPPRCADLPDLALSFVVQCKSDCFGVPIYFSVANLGGARSAPATVRVLGYFRHRPPAIPLTIEALAPGEHTSLIDMPATGDVRLVLETSDEQCSTENDELALDAYDRHCGFLP